MLNALQKKIGAQKEKKKFDRPQKNVQPLQKRYMGQKKKKK